jgi:hypothetical protein
METKRDRTVRYIGGVCILFGMTMPAAAQEKPNCFLVDFQPRTAIVPPFEDVPAVGGTSTIRVTVNPADTICRIPRYIFGNAVAVWMGPNQNNPTLISHLRRLSPTLIRFPGGSWSDIYFWSGNPGDLPPTVPNGMTGEPDQAYPQFGPSHSLTPDEYYELREEVGTQGLITINYAYARYGLSERPAEQAAHFAADWVRYDNGRTRFWEIGNENAGFWEAGWQIDTVANKDGQPRYITGELYGRHFRIFADSMRAAAAQVGAQVYIGGQILHFDGTNSSNAADRQWNEGFFREAGDSPDFYVMHNYFGTTANARTLLNFATEEVNRNASFIRQDIAARQAAPRPVAITEYNMGFAGSLPEGSFIKGMQAVILFCELIKQEFGLSARWLVANWESDGMFYNGPGGSIPQWNPRPEFYYAYYTQRFTGDHMVAASVPGSQAVLAYATTFASGHVGVIVVNKIVSSFTATLAIDNFAPGARAYVYSLTGGTDNGEFSQFVNVNDEGPIAPGWGPYEALDSLRAYAYPTSGNEVKFPLPGRSVQLILLEPASVSVREDATGRVDGFELFQNFPNPFNSSTTVSYSLDAAGPVSLRIYDAAGRCVATVLEDEVQDPGRHSYSFDAGNLASGVYFCRLQAGAGTRTRPLLLMK